MSISKSVKKYLAAGAFLLSGLGFGVQANASAIFLIGSDVVSFHGDTSYINPVFDQMANFGTKKLLFVSDWGASSVNYTAGNISITFAGMSALGTGADLSAYSGVYVDGTSGCCSDAGGEMVAGSAAVLSAFVAGGGSLGVGNYQGNSFWDSILGFTGFTGVTSGNSVLCEDPGLSTASGTAFGFNASYSESCFVHQTYDPAYWASKGYFALQTDGNTGGGHFGDWVTMASGFVEPGTVPEPASIALLGLGFAGLAAARKRKTK